MDASARSRRPAQAAGRGDPVTGRPTIDRLREDEAALSAAVAAARAAAGARVESARREAEAIAATARVEAERVAEAIRVAGAAAFDAEREAAREALEREEAELEARAASRRPAVLAWLVALVRAEAP